MNLATSLYSAETDPWPERCFDLLRGASVLTGNDLLLRLARTVSRHPEAQLDVAFNHRQIASKLWARDELAKLEPGRIGLAWIVGGWYAVLAALLLEDPRLDLGRIVSFDIDPGVATVARSLNEPQLVAGRFDAVTADMYQLDYRTPAPDLVVNTSCEHIDDLAGWLDRVPKGTRVLLQSNDYFSESEHINALPSLEAFATVAKLGKVEFSGALYLRKYTRFMLIGRV
jgi:hypothetical protein